MARKSICPYCNKPVEVIDAFKMYNNKKYHSYCYRKFQTEKYNDFTGNLDIKDKLQQYIKQLMKVEELPVLIQNQINKYCDNLTINYQDIYDALYYYVEILGNKLDQKYGIGIVPSIIDESKEFFQNLPAIHSNLKKHKIYDFDNIVRVKPIDYQNNKIIDISKL